MTVLEDLGRYDLSHLRHCVGAGEALNAEVIEAWKAGTGLTIHDGYGQTETVILVAKRSFPGRSVVKFVGSSCASKSWLAKPGAGSKPENSERRPVRGAHGLPVSRPAHAEGCRAPWQRETPIEDDDMIPLMKTLHVLAAVVLVGNLIMAPFWRRRLAKSDGLQVRAAADRSVRVADMVFTLPGWVVLLVSGVLLASWQGLFRQGWIHISLLLFVGWLAAWHVGVLRARKAMLSKVEEAVAAGQSTEELAQCERQWARWSYLSALLAVLILIVMVWRPFA